MGTYIDPQRGAFAACPNVPAYSTDWGPERAHESSYLHFSGVLRHRLRTGSFSDQWHVTDQSGAVIPNVQVVHDEVDGVNLGVLDG